MSSRCVLFLAPLLCVASFAFAQDRYVSIGGSDSNNGKSPTTAWRTLTHAAEMSASGTRIHVGAGTFGTGTKLEGIEVKSQKRLFIHGAGMGKTILKANAGFSKTINYHYSAGVTAVAYTAVFIVHGKNTQVDLWDMTLDANHLSAPTRLACAVYADGGSGLLNRVEMRNAGAATPDGNQRHVGMIANGKNATDTSFVTLTNCHIHHWNKVGVVMGGKLLTGTIQTSLIEGRGRLGSGKAAQNGIQIMDGGASLLIRDNVIRDIWYVPTAWNATGILDLKANGNTTIEGNRIQACKTGYYHLEGTAGSVTFKNNRIASCGWGVAAYSNGLTATGNDIDADIGVYVAGAVSPSFNGNYYSDFRQNSGYSSKYVAAGNTAVQDTNPLTKPLGLDPQVKIGLGAGAGPEDLVTGDFNADGKIDFAVANGGTNRVVVYFGSGGTDFSTISPKSVSVPGHPILLTTGEFSGSAGQDMVVVAQTGKAYVLKNNGSGSFSLGTGFQVVAATDAPSAIGSGQINGAFQDDFVVGYKGNGLTVPGGTKVLYVKNSVIGAGLTLSGTVRSIEDLVVTDINGDTKPDILAVDTKNNSGTNNKLQVWLRDALSVSYGSMTSYGLEAGGRGLGVGDLDQDGDQDVAVSSDQIVKGELQVFLGQGGTNPTGALVETQRSPFRIDSGAGRVQIVDLQDDRDPDTERVDVVVNHPSKSKMTRLRKWVNGDFQSYRGQFTGLDPRSFAWAQLDGKLLPDLLLAQRGDHNVIVHLDDSDALLQAYGMGGPGVSSRIPQIALAGSSALPLEGNANFVLQVRNARAFSVGVFLFSGDASYSATPCSLQVSFLTLFWLPAIATDRFGNASFPMPIPNNPSLVGQDFYSQLAVFDPLGCFINSFSLSQGVRLRIGH